MRGHWLVWIIVGSIVVAIAAGLLGRWMIRRGMKEPFVVRLINRASDKVIDAIKKPVTIAVMEEVIDVIQAGHYTQNIARAVEENRYELEAMIAEKVKSDPASRGLRMVPFHERIIDEASQATLRVLMQILVDPRTEELVNDILRDNITQLRKAVREQDL